MTNPNVTQFADVTGVNPGTLYLYRARAITLSGPLSYTNEAQATTPAYSGSGGTPYLSDIAVFPPAIAESQTATGTLTLSAPATSPIVITLACSDATAVTMPSSITIPTGAISAQFPISGVSGKGTVNGNVLTVSAKMGAWMQAAYLTEMPTLIGGVTSNITSVPGNNCAVIYWPELPDGVAKSVLIYRRTAGSAFQLLASLPGDATLYADNTVQNGTNYDYQAVVVCQDGTNSTANPPSVTPTSSAPQVNWLQTPTIDNAGLMSLSISVNASDCLDYTVIVDGFETGTLGDGDGGVLDAKAYLDTTTWSNGSHNVQVVSRRLSSGFAAATSVAVISTNNSISERSNPILVNQLKGEVFIYKSKKQAAANDGWTVNLYRRDPITALSSLVRSWQGTGQNVSVAWDGKDGNGNSVPGGSFEVQMTSFFPPTPLEQIYVAGGLPVALALISRNGPNSGMITRDVDKVEGTKDIAIAKAKIFERAYAKNGKIAATLINSKGSFQVRGRKFLLDDVIGWMRSSVKDFYAYGHAHYRDSATDVNGVVWRMPPVLNWGDVAIIPDHMTPSKDPGTIRLDFANKRKIFVADEVLRRGGSYYFAWLDACNTLGGVDAVSPRASGAPYTFQNIRQPSDASINSDWDAAFNLDLFGGVMGGNGDLPLDVQVREVVVNNVVTNTYVVPTAGFFFYKYFWEKVESGVVTIFDCFSYSQTRTQNLLNVYSDYQVPYWFYPWYNNNGNNLYTRLATKGIGYLPYGGN